MVRTPSSRGSCCTKETGAKALRWLRDRWPEHFFVERHVEPYQNQMYSGVSTPTDWRFDHASNLDRLLAERLPRDSGTVDFRIFPWSGLHFPDAPGHPGLDAGYRQIVSFLNRIKMTDALQTRIRTESAGVAPDFWDYETFTRKKVRRKVKARASARNRLSPQSKSPMGDVVVRCVTGRSRAGPFI